AGMTVVTRDEELLDRTGSMPAKVRFTLFVFGPAVRGLAITVRLAMPLLAIVPKEKVTIPFVCEKVPRDVVAETKTVPGGSESVTTVPGEALGPALLTLNE